MVELERSRKRLGWCIAGKRMAAYEKYFFFLRKKIRNGGKETLDKLRFARITAQVFGLIVMSNERIEKEKQIR